MPYDGTGFKTVPVSAAMREIFGPNGEHWIKNQARNASGGRCLLGALAQIGVGLSDKRYDQALTQLCGLIDNTYRQRWRRELRILGFNDRRSTTFFDISTLLDRLEALELKED
jgi:hypothetical protein